MSSRTNVRDLCALIRSLTFVRDDSTFDNYPQQSPLRSLRLDNCSCGVLLTGVLGNCSCIALPPTSM